MVYKMPIQFAVVFCILLGIFALFTGEVGFAIFIFIGVGCMILTIKEFSKNNAKTEDVQDSTSDNDEDKPS